MARSQRPTQPNTRPPGLEQVKWYDAVLFLQLAEPQGEGARRAYERTGVKDETTKNAEHGECGGTVRTMRTAPPADGGSGVGVFLWRRKNSPAELASGGDEEDACGSMR